MLKRIAPFARTNRNKSTAKPIKPSTIISASGYPNSWSTQLSVTTRHAGSETFFVAIDRVTALHLLESIHQFGTAGAGDVEPLHREWQGCSGFVPETIASSSAVLRTVFRSWPWATA